MGTRSIICIYYKGRFVVAQYSQWDGYPSGQGLDIYEFLTIPGNIQRLIDGLAYIKVLETQEDIDKARQEIDIDSEPSLSRNTGAKILNIIADAKMKEMLVPVQLDLAFVHDNIFCEYAYVVDLDSAVLEVYAGSVGKDGNETRGRLAALDLEEPDMFRRATGDSARSKTVPDLLIDFAFDALPGTKEEFLKACEVPSEEDDVSSAEEEEK